MKNSYITATDQFCGAGGSSIGATKKGVEVKIALNHWKLAVDTHNQNFPNTYHECTDISAVDPRRYPSTDILITSPECTNHSLAKGKKKPQYKQDLFGNIIIDPAEERSRATMWDVPRFAEFHDYNLIIVENVVDAGKWVLFGSWLHAMNALGYDHEVVYLNSMFAWPTPQSRDRMYTIFWKKGNKAPNLSISPPAFCPRCGHNVEARQFWKKSLKWGRYGPQYFYVCPNHPPQNIRRGQTKKEWQAEWSIIPYYYAAFNAIDWTIPSVRIGDREKQGMQPLEDKTIERIKYGLEVYGRNPLIVTGRYTSGLECRVRDARISPIPTQPGDSSHAVVFPWMVETGYTHSDHKRVTAGTDPLSTQTTRQTMGMVSAFLVKQNDIKHGNPGRRTITLDRPAGTVVTDDTHALIGLPPGFIAEFHGTGKADGLDDPLMCVTSGGNHHALVNVPPEALGSMIPGFIAEMHGASKVGGLDEALMCVTSGGGHHAVITPDSLNSYLTYYYGSLNASGITEPLNTMTAVDRVNLVSNVMENIDINDLTFRMFAPKEVGAAMAFPADYVVLGTNREKVKQYGNAVTPPAMELLVDRCVETLL